MKGRIDFIFLYLVLGVFLINLPYLSPSIFPQHDTLYIFQVFYFFYNEYFFHHTIAQWMPYGAYGIPAALFQAGTLTPAEYFSGFVGALLGIKNVLFLFKFAVLLEQLTFLLGMYFLSKLLFKRRTIILLVCIASFCSMAWGYQLFFNLRVYELFPFALYFLVLFFERKRPVYFWMAGITGIIWSLGAGAYLSFLFIFLGCIISGVLFAFHHGAWKDIGPRSKLDIAAAVFFFVLAAAYFLFLKNSFEDIAILHRSSTSSAANSLQTFLGYGGNASLRSVVFWFFSGTPLYTPLGAGRDNTVYAGFASIVFFIWALAFVRNKYFVAILAVFIALVWLSFGGIIANLVYYFPGMKFYRHVGLVYPLVKVCVALGAGFGLADFLECSKEVRMKRLVLTLGICLLLMDTNQNFYRDRGIMVFIMVIYFMALMTWLCIRSVVMIWSKIKKYAVPARLFEHVFAVLLIGALCVDVNMFQEALYNSWPKLPDKILTDLKSVEVNELQFAGQRGQEPTERQSQAFLLQQEAKNKFSAQYESMYSFAQFDPCNGIPKSGVLTNNVKDFLDIKFLDIEEKNHIRGCSAPKLRLLGSERFFKNTKDESDFMQSMVKTDENALLQVPSGVEAVVSAGKTGYPREVGTIVSTNFTANELGVGVDIKKPGGAWLVYADSFYPGWHAYVDGASTAVYEAFVAFKAVFIPEGRHGVRFVFFNSQTLVLSYILAVFGLMAGAGIFFLLLITLMCSFDLSDHLS